MTYTVVITDAAAMDLAEAFAYIQQRSPLNAERWIRAIYREIHSLESGAGYGRARESDFLGVELRQRIFKSHRIIFSVDQDKKVVTVHHVRHGARRAIGEAGDVEEP
jgi:plasmid stabilization system protein ParE